MRYLILAALTLLPATAQAQLFPRLFGAKSTAQVGSSCPGGVCPTGAAQQATYRSVGAIAAVAAPMKAIQNRAGHWSYPGTIDSHLEGTHGVAMAGMTHQQKLALHDSLHEGTSGSYRAVGGYGSIGSAIRSGGSSGGFGVGTVLADGAIVTSVGVTVVTSEAPASVEGLESRGMLTDWIDRRSNKLEFRKALFEAIKQAKDRGVIDDFKAFAIRGLSYMPGNLEIMQASLHEAAISEGMAAPQKIDWEKLIELIIKYLPYILDLFKK